MAAGSNELGGASAVRDHFENASTPQGPPGGATEAACLRTALSCVADAVICTDGRGRISFLNSVAESMTGWGRDEALGRLLSEVFRVVDESVAGAVERSGAGGLQDGAADSSRRTVLVSRDGGRRPIEEVSQPIRSEDGQPAGLALVFRDLSESRRTAVLQARLAAIVESSDDAILSKSLEGVIQTWNAAAETLFGYSAADAIGQSLSLVIPEDRLEEERRILERLGRGERLSHFETVRLARDGRRIDVSMTASPVRNADGVVVGASTVAREVTAERAAEREALRNAERLTLLWQAASILITSETLDALIRGMYERIAAHLQLDVCINYMLEPDSERLRLHSHFGIGDEIARGIETLKFGEAVCGAVAQSRSSMSVPHVQRCEDPRVGLVRGLGVRAYVCNPLLADGRFIGTLSFGSRTRDEFDADELEFLNTITHYVTLACERLRLVEELRESDRKKDEFIALLAHELRNPLAPIRNGLQILRMARDQGVRERSQEMMERQLTHLVRLVDDLLDVSRIGSSRVELRRSRVRLVDAVNAALETARPVVDAAGHRLEVALPSGEVLLDADMTRLAQIFSNLLINSAKFTRPGGWIRLSAAVVGGWVEVVVQDDGIGIPKRSLSTIFNMFYQVDRSIERSSGGLGIGLALVKGLAELHGGTVAAESDGADCGSTFRVRLPIVEE